MASANDSVLRETVASALEEKPMRTTTGRRLLNGLLSLALIGVVAPVWAQPIVVTTTAELEAALTPANAGARILVRAGEYDLGQALTVPDGAALVGEGEMDFDESGLPTGFAPAGRTVLRSTLALAGDVVTLGDGAILQSLVIEDAPGRATGNPVVVSSRAPGDFVSAEVVECEIINPNPSVIVPQGPIGRGLVAITRNPNLAADPPPHDGAVVWVRLSRSIVRSPGAGYGIFAINFASHAEIRLVLHRNVIGGGLNASGGVSRPDAVTGSSVDIQSGRNLYRSDSAVPTLNGWSLVGGSTVPIPGLASAASTFNSLQVHSNDDDIFGFTHGISAVGGLRTVPVSGPSSSNGIDMNLHGTRIQTEAGPLAADLLLMGAQSTVAGVSPGDDNTLQVLLRQGSGSGPRADKYADSTVPSGTDPGVGNALAVVGSMNAFLGTNDGFDPIPPEEFFTEH
jgi:hypothetical protein